MSRWSAWCQTYTGKAFTTLDSDPEDVCIEDIAHSLSLQCRFAGHCEKFYSVAEHCVRCSLIVSKQAALEALMHDAAEAYLVDVPRPIKPHLQGYESLERRVHTAICLKFGMPIGMREEVKKADLVMLATEARDLMKPPPVPWDLPHPPLPSRIVPVPHHVAEKMFLESFFELMGTGVERVGAV